MSLKYYELPEGNLTKTKNSKWYSNEYGPIVCPSLDFFAVPLVGKFKARVFYIYDSEDYFEIEGP